MTNFFIHIFTISFVYNGYAQVHGCTDSAATNYNQLATVNDGSCTYATTNESFSAKGSLAAFAASSSGLEFTDGCMWTHNDSGNPSYIFKIDTTTAAMLQRVNITNYPNVDWEDITADSNYIYIGDFGNNNGDRTDLKILKLRKDSLGTGMYVNATAQAINFSYADQTSFVSNSNTNFDCESVISIGDSLYLFSKDRGDFKTRVYKLPKTPGTYSVAPYTSYNVNGKITGVDYSSQTNEVALIGYMSSDKNSFIYYLNDFTGTMFFSGNKRRVEIGNSTTHWQTEGIAYVSPGELFISCETTSGDSPPSSDVPATLYTTYKSSMVFAGVNNIQNHSANIKIYPNPVADFFHIESDETIQQIILSDINGKIIYNGTFWQNSIEINRADFNNDSAGCYFIKIRMSSNLFFGKLFLTPLAN